VDTKHLILEIYLSLLNLAEDTRDSIRGSRDNKRQWARIHWSFYKKKEPVFFWWGEVLAIGTAQFQ
jgi:hypothetical protein